MRDWWDLPGPDEFVSQVARDLTAGTNTVVCLPRHTPAGFHQALRRCLPLNDGLHLERFQVENEEDNPAKTLFDRLLPNAPSEVSRTAVALALDADFEGQVILVDGMEPGSWKRWQPFLSDYHKACHTSQSSSPGVFCIVLEDVLADSVVPAHSTTLRTHHWKGKVTFLDMLLYVSQHISSSNHTDLERQVTIWVIANLALWDPAVADRLFECDLDEILEPDRVLALMAEDREWVEQYPNCRSQWSNGQEDEFEGEVRGHSAWVALHGPDREVARRVWRGQIAVLFPFIEERRQDLLAALRPQLTLPHIRTKPSGGQEVVTSAEELDVGDLKYQLDCLGLSKKQIGALARQLLAMRNALSHFASQQSPIARRQLCSPEMLSWREVLDLFVAERRAMMGAAAGRIGADQPVCLR